MRCRWFDPRKRGLVDFGRAALRRPARRVLVAALAASFLSPVLGCHRGKAPVVSSEEQRIPDQEARDFTLTESSAGTKNWTLRADYAAMYNREHLVDATRVHIDFFDDEGTMTSTLVADRGEVDQRTNDLRAHGNVRITTDDGVIMETDSLRFVNKTGRILSDGFVRVTRRGDVLTGYGFESDATLDHFRLRRQVRADVQGAEAADGFGP
jgi:LPS export ABC transporter protein LptC